MPNDIRLLTDLEWIKLQIKQQNTEDLEDLCREANARELAFIMSHLNMDDRVALLNLLPSELGADILQDIPDAHTTDIISEMEVADAVAIFNEMESDEQVDLIIDLEDNEAEAILSELDEEDAAEVRRLVEYDPDSAGGLMVTEYISLPDDYTVQDAVVNVKANQDEYEDYQIKYLYVTDQHNTFLGIVEMYDLILAEPNRLLKELLSHAKSFPVHVSLDDLVGFFEAHDYRGVAVIDEKGKMLGVVLRQDALLANSEKLTKEHLESQGIVGGEELRTMPVWLRSKRRLSWLSVNIFLNIIAASVIAFHQDTLTSVIALAVFLPIISDMSGCSGNQAVAVSMRELSVGTVRPREVFTVLWQELSVGLINGLVLGLLIGIAAFLWKGNVFLGMVVGGALMLNTLVAVSLGGTLPLILKGFDIDPALASGPILTTITDMLGFFLTLTFAALALSHLGGI